MLSELEYLYFEPGLKSNGSFATYESSSACGGGTSNDALTAAPNALVWLKSGMPLVWWISWSRVT